MPFRTFAFITLLMTAGVTGIAQVPVSQEGKTIFFMNHERTFNIATRLDQDEEIQQKVRSALNLSDAQVNALSALLTMRNQSVEQIMESAGETHRKLEDLLKQPNPNPTEVGSAFLATRTIDDRVHAAEEKFRTDFGAMLTADQRATLSKLKTSSAQISVLEEAGILERTVVRDFTLPVMSVEPSLAIGIHHK